MQGEVVEIAPGHGSIVIAGSRGAGPWVAEHLLADFPDVHYLTLDAEAPLPRLVSPAVAILAVPDGELADYASRLTSVLPPGSGVVVVTAGTMGVLDVVAGVEPRWQVCGLHMLFDIYRAGPRGQTLFVVRPEGADGGVADWLAGLIEAAGGIVKTGSVAVHDRTMAVVQALPHRLLVSFVDEVVRSDLHLENDLWAARTPLFEALLGLGVSVLDTRRENSLVAAQELPTAGAVMDGFAAAWARFGAVEPSGVGEHVAGVREGLWGAAYDSLRRVGISTLTAIQAKRETLAGYRASGALVGLATVTEAGGVRVGRVVATTPNEVTLEEVLVGPRGRAALLEGPGVRNARRLGVAGRVTRTTFALAHVAVLSEAELEASLDAWLGVIERDVRLLVPESVSAAGVLAAVAELPMVSSASAVDEVVRVGQRSVVLRIGIRADRDIEATIESVRAFVSGVYRWPAGVALAPTGLGGSQGGSDGHRVVFLGPRGSFSEVAAASVSSLVRVPARGVEPVAAFDDVLGAVAAGDVGVLPISSSASGLVSRAVEALLAAPDGVVAGGMVDVAVRFDAYGPAGSYLEEMRGAKVYSHPQALAQCGGFIRRWKLEPVPVSSTAAALEALAASGERAVAFGVADRGEDLGLVTLEREVDDLPGSLTRFLIVGPSGAFGEAVGGARPTLRRVWVGAGLREGSLAATGNGARLDELLLDDAGRFLLVSSGPGPAPSFADRERFLGEIPWSPRTPVVRPAP